MEQSHRSMSSSDVTLSSDQVITHLNTLVSDHGNYSTAFPQTQVETLTQEQIRFSQSIKEEGGVSFYSGLNSNGDLFIGNQVINPVTGQITNEDIAQLNVVGEENTTIQTFSELVLTDKLTVIGGASNQLESIFAGPVTFQGQQLH